MVDGDGHKMQLVSIYTTFLRTFRDLNIGITLDSMFLSPEVISAMLLKAKKVVLYPSE